MLEVIWLLLVHMAPSRPDTGVTGTAETKSVPPTFEATVITPQSPLSVLIKLGNSTIDSSKSFRVPQITETATGMSMATEPLREITTTVAPVTKTVKMHHHLDRKFGPSFVESENSTKITVQLGETADLNCRITLLQDKTVSWVRKRRGRPPELLTVGTAIYAADERISLGKRYPGNWKMQILKTHADDEGFYECQISTHPPRIISIYLHINSPTVWIVDESGSPLLEVYYKTDSNLVLVCRARDIDTPVALVWLHENVTLNEDVSRGGIGVRTEQIPKGANSTLKLAHLNASDSGNYTCAVKGIASSTVTVHVLNEESLAELHAGGAKVVHLAAITLPITLSAIVQYQHLNIFFVLISLMSFTLGAVL